MEQIWVLLLLKTDGHSEWGGEKIKGQCHYVANVERLADYMRLKYRLVPLE